MGQRERKREEERERVEERETDRQREREIDKDLALYQPCALRAKLRPFNDLKWGPSVRSTKASREQGLYSPHTMPALYCVSRK